MSDRRHGEEPFDETVKTGGWGNYVRVREKGGRPGAEAVLLWTARTAGETGYESETLGFAVRDGAGDLVPEAVDEAVDEARNLSVLLQRGRLPEEARPEEPTTLGEMFDAYREEMIPTKEREYRRRELRRSLACWETYLGRGFAVEDFGRREWESFTRDRTSGRIDSTGEVVPDAKERREVSRTTAGQDLKTLRQVCTWGAEWRLPAEGGFLLDRDPTRGLPIPKNRDPKRPVCGEDRYRRLLEGAEAVRVGHLDGEDAPDEKVRPPLREILVLCWETGRRVGAVVRLRWSDWFPDEATYGVLRWRADSDKLGKEWRAPVTPRVRETLEALRRERPGIGEAWVLPAPEAEGKHVRVDTARGWLLDAEREAGLDHPEGFGFHALRRAWATRRKHLPAQDVARAGGWKNVATLQEVYQHPDPETVERVVLAGGE